MQSFKLKPVVILNGLLLLALTSPALAAAGLEQAKTLMSKGQLQDALQVTNEVLEKDSKSIEARFIKGLILTRQNQLDDARDVFLDISKDHPELPEPYNNLAVIYAAQGEYEKARGALQNAINTHPSYATAHENLGDIFAKMASEAYNQALELDNNNETAREKLSMISELFSVPEVKAPAKVATIAARSDADQQPTAKPRPEPKPKPETDPDPEPEPATRPAPVSKKPAPEPASEKSPGEIEKAAVLQAVHDWRDAWAAQNVDAYLSHYAKDYADPGMSREDWVQQRHDRLTRPAYIKVTLANESVVMHGEDHAQVNFSQGYQSDTYSDHVSKTLLLKRTGNRWLIVQEESH